MIKNIKIPENSKKLLLGLIEERNKYVESINGKIRFSIQCIASALKVEGGCEFDIEKMEFKSMKKR